MRPYSRELIYRLDYIFTDPKTTLHTFTNDLTNLQNGIR